MEGKKLEGQHSLMGYLPALVVKQIVDEQLHLAPQKQSEKKAEIKLPQYFAMSSVCLFADISGFTKLSETYSSIGRMGAEVLAFMLNRYMETIITIIGKNGGDIFKFAGDAILVIWPKTDQDQVDLCRRAIQCGLEIQEKSKHNIANLSVKVGIGIGEFKISFFGGQFSRCEYLIIGEGMKQACESETHAAGGGETICSGDVYELTSKFYNFELAEAGGHGPSDSKEKYYKILSQKVGQASVQTTADAFIMRTKFKTEKLRDKSSILKLFVPAAITIHLDIDQEFWAKELRMITVMFLLLGVDLSHTRDQKGMDRVQVIVKTIQRCVYRTMGSLNKFLMDDKGSVMLMCWGLPPISSTEDHLRSVLTGFDLIRELKKLNCSAYIGISSGSAFSGVCGTIGNRKEYSLLGERVNLSARNMQKAIEIAKSKKESYSMLICDRTAAYIANKMPSFCRVFTKLKGFKDYIEIYQAGEDLKPTTEYKNSTILSDIKTHLFNISYDSPNDEKCQLLTSGQEEEEQNKERIAEIRKKMASFKAPNTKQMIDDSVTMKGREEQLKECFAKIDDSVKNKLNSYILVTGEYGSGKSLFIRCLMKKYLDQKTQISSSTKSKLKYIFTNVQKPNTLLDPLNGFNTIMREIYKILIDINPPQKFQKDYTLNKNTKTLLVDFIGAALIESNCILLIKYIQEILDHDIINNHIVLPNNENLSDVFPLEKLKEIDRFFEPRKFSIENNESKIQENEGKICDFFFILIKKYLDVLNKSNLPLFLLVENCNQIDQISIKFMHLLRNNKEKNNMIVIASYQEPVINYMVSDTDYFRKSKDLYDYGENRENTFVMHSINSDTDLNNLIRFYLTKKTEFLREKNIENKVNEIFLGKELKNFLLSKTMNGNPLLVQELLNRLIDGKYINYTYINHPPSGEENKRHQLIYEKKSKLEDMIKFKDYSKLELPYRIEKLMGYVIDKLKSTKEIIILKCASVIGNIFDLNTLFQINPIKNTMFEDLLDMIYEFEKMGIVDILYDLEPENLVAKFKLPFFREVLYQRMLSEQKTALHSEIAKKFKSKKFSYMKSEDEQKVLLRHLVESENTVMNVMEEKRKNAEKNNKSKEKEIEIQETLNMNNLKIYYSKKICDTIKENDLLSKDKNSAILAATFEKKSDSNITWEPRYIAISKDKFKYWYQDKDFTNNKMPLGYFELKEINTIRILPENYFSGKKNIIEIKVNNFYKKDIQKGERTFYFSKEMQSKIYQMLIYLNFLRVKSIYDNFTRQFGEIQLPMNHEIKTISKTKLKMKLNPDKLKGKVENSSNSVSTYLRRSIKGSFSNKNNPSNFALKKRSSFINSNITIENEEKSRNIMDLKNDIEFIWKTGMLILIANIQKRNTDRPQDIADNPNPATLFEVDFVDKAIRILLEEKNKNDEEKRNKDKKDFVKQSEENSGLAGLDQFRKSKLSFNDKNNNFNLPNEIIKEEEHNSEPSQEDSNSNKSNEDQEDNNKLEDNNNNNFGIGMRSGSNKKEPFSDNKSETRNKLLNDSNNNNEQLVKSRSSNERNSSRNFNNNNINQFEEGIGRKMINLEMNNDEMDEIFNMFSDNRHMKK